MELTADQMLRIAIAHQAYIRSDAKLALANKEVELAKSQTELAVTKLTAVVDLIAIELGLNVEDKKGKYNIDIDTFALTEKKG